MSKMFTEEELAAEEEFYQQEQENYLDNKYAEFIHLYDDWTKGGDKYKSISDSKFNSDTYSPEEVGAVDFNLSNGKEDVSVKTIKSNALENLFKQYDKKRKENGNVYNEELENQAFELFNKITFDPTNEDELNYNPRTFNNPNNQIRYTDPTQKGKFAKSDLLDIYGKSFYFGRTEKDREADKEKLARMDDDSLNDYKEDLRTQAKYIADKNNGKVGKYDMPTILRCIDNITLSPRQLGGEGFDINNEQHKNEALFHNFITNLYQKEVDARGKAERFVDVLNNSRTQTAALFAASSASSDELEGISDYRRKANLENQLAFNSITEIGKRNGWFLDGLEYIGSTALSQLFNTGFTFAGGAIGGAAAGGVGAFVGGALGGALVNYGEAKLDQYEDFGKVNEGAAIVQTVGYSLLDGLGGVASLGRKTTAKIAESAAKDILVGLNKKGMVSIGKTIGKNIAHLGKNMVTEGITETAQSGIVGRSVHAYLDKDHSFLKEGETKESAIMAQVDEFFAGMFGAGGYGAVVQPINMVKQIQLVKEANDALVSTVGANMNPQEMAESRTKALELLKQERKDNTLTEKDFEELPSAIRLQLLMQTSDVNKLSAGDRVALFMNLLDAEMANNSRLGIEVEKGRQKTLNTLLESETEASKKETINNLLEKSKNNQKIYESKLAIATQGYDSLLSNEGNFFSRARRKLQQRGLENSFRQRKAMSEPVRKIYDAYTSKYNGNPMFEDNYTEDDYIVNGENLGFETSDRRNELLTLRAEAVANSGKQKSQGEFSYTDTKTGIRFVEDADGITVLGAENMREPSTENFTIKYSDMMGKDKNAQRMNALDIAINKASNLVAYNNRYNKILATKVQMINDYAQARRPGSKVRVIDNLGALHKETENLKNEINKLSTTNPDDPNISKLQKQISQNEALISAAKPGAYMWENNRTGEIFVLAERISSPLTLAMKLNHEIFHLAFRDFVRQELEKNGVINDEMSEKERTQKITDEVKKNKVINEAGARFSELHFTLEPRKIREFLSNFGKLGKRIAKLPNNELMNFQRNILQTPPYTDELGETTTITPSWGIDDVLSAVSERTVINTEAQIELAEENPITTQEAEETTEEKEEVSDVNRTENGEKLYEEHKEKIDSLKENDTFVQISNGEKIATVTVVSDDGVVITDVKGNSFIINKDTKEEKGYIEDEEVIDFFDEKKYRIESQQEETKEEPAPEPQNEPTKEDKSKDNKKVVEEKKVQQETKEEVSPTGEEGVFPETKEKVVTKKEETTAKEKEEKVEEPKEKEDSTTPSAKKSNRFEITTPDNELKIKGQYRIVDISTLTDMEGTSIQNRMRKGNRNAEMQEFNIGRDLNPERVMESPTTDSGAPIVDSQGHILSGHGRTHGIQYAYENNLAENYKKVILAKAKELGIPIPKDVENPVLIRELDSSYTEEELVDIASRSNQSAMLAKTAAENAISDAIIIENDPNMIDLLNPDEEGNMLSADNYLFMRAFASKINDRSIRKQDGSFTDEADRRAKNAVLAYLFKDYSNKSNLLVDLIENASTLKMKRLVSGMLKATPAIIQANIQKPKLNIAEFLGQALDEFIKYRNGLSKGVYKSAEDYKLNATSMFGDAVSDEVLFAFGMLNDYANSAIDTFNFLTNYADYAEKDPGNDNLWGEKPRTPLELMELAKEKTERQKQERSKDGSFDGINYSAVGDAGAKRLDEKENTTYRMDNLAIAKKMHVAKKDPENIKFATGWELGVDDKWRYEEDNAEVKDTTKVLSTIEKKKTNNQTIYLSNIIQDNNVVKAYPGIKHLEVIDCSNNKLFGGGAEWSTRRIWLPLESLKTNLEYFKEVLNHEVQHIIQEIEGFATGGNPNQFSLKYPESVRRKKYHRLAGEVEARNVGRRAINLTNKERKNILLERTEDVPRNKQLLPQKNTANENSKALDMSSVGNAKLNGDDFKDLEPGDDFDRIEKNLKPLKGKEIKNTHLGISVRFYSNNDINHLVQYLLGMENAEAHKFAAKNIVPLLRKAEIAIVHGEKKENKPITNKWIRMFSPMIFNNGVYIATITIKESKKNIYSIASLKIDNGMSFNKGLSQKNNKIILLAPSIEKDIPFNVDTLSYFVGNVNQTNPKILFGGKEYEFTPESAYEKIINVANIFIDKVNSSTEVKNNSIISQQDAAYLDAVRKGDMETAQRMVDEAAKTAGYTIKSYHGTLATDFTEFKKSFIGSRFSFDDKGFFFIDRKNIAEDYARSEFDSNKKGRVLDVYLRVKKPLIVNAQYALKEGLGEIFKDNDVIDVWDNYSAFLLEEAETKRVDGIIIDDGATKMTVVFDSEQIKSADPVTYDDNGNVIPLSQRFNTKNPDINYSSIDDAIYMDAVNKGDMKTAQEMVDKAAREAGYPVKAYHGTNQFGFTKFDVSKSDDKSTFFFSDDLEHASTYAGRDIFKTKSIKDAKTFKYEKGKKYTTEELKEAYDVIQSRWHVYGEIKINEEKQYISHAGSRYSAKQVMEMADQISKEGIYGVYLNTDNFLEVDAKNRAWGGIEPPDDFFEYVQETSWGGQTPYVTTRDYAKYAKAKGYDGLIIRNLYDWGNRNTPVIARFKRENSGAKTDYILFDSNRVKSADPVTYDDAGNVIPLSQRFNIQNPDIRYSSVDDVLNTQAEKEYNDVVTKYKGTAQWLKAPNGKPTNLTERQWVQVRTPSFKKWFGDWENDPENSSKVVDENGEPKVVYHGTNVEFNIFDTNKFGLFDNGSKFRIAGEDANGKLIIQTIKDEGFFFSAQKGIANDHAEGATYLAGGSPRIISAYLKMKNPLVIEMDKFYADIKRYDTQLWYDKHTAKILDEFHKGDYDGIWIKNPVLPKDNLYIVFEPNQIKSATDNVGIFDPENPDINYSRVTDENIISELEASPKVTGYRTVVLNDDGTLGSPMASGLRNKGKGKQSTSNFMIGAWEQAEERPELANDKGKIDLIKPSGKSVGGVDYNPYIHSRLNCVNSQFKDAWQRPDLVYIENEIPQTDLDSGYHAEKAAKPVGIHKWNGGDLILSRYDKPIRVVPWEEVADDWVKKFKERGVEFDIVSPQLLPIFEERGVEILPPHKNMGDACNEAYKAWKENKRSRVLEEFEENNDGINYSSVDDAAYFDAINNGDMETVQRMVDVAARKAGYVVKHMYHATYFLPEVTPFREFDPLKGRKYNEGRDSVRTPIFFSTDKDAAIDIGTQVVEGNLKTPRRLLQLMFDEKVKPYVYDVYIKEGRDDVLKSILTYWDYENPDHVKWLLKEISSPYNPQYRKIEKQLAEGDWYLLESTPVQDALKELGFDGFYTFEQAKNLAVFDNKRIKSSAPITFDVNGNIIPLSQRFDFSNSDINYATVEDVLKMEGGATAKKAFVLQKMLENGESIPEKDKVSFEKEMKATQEKWLPKIIDHTYLVDIKKLLNVETPNYKQVMDLTVFIQAINKDINDEIIKMRENNLTGREKELTEQYLDQLQVLRHKLYLMDLKWSADQGRGLAARNIAINSKNEIFYLRKKMQDLNANTPENNAELERLQKRLDFATAELERVQALLDEALEGKINIYLPERESSASKAQRQHEENKARIKKAQTRKVNPITGEKGEITGTFEENLNKLKFEYDSLFTGGLPTERDMKRFIDNVETLLIVFHPELLDDFEGKFLPRFYEIMVNAWGQEVFPTIDVFRDFYDNYGVVPNPKVSEITRIKRRNKATALWLSKIADAKKGNVPKRTGRPYYKQSDEERHYAVILNHLLLHNPVEGPGKNAPIESKNPEQEIRTPQQQEIRRLENLIKDVNLEIDKLENIVAENEQRAANGEPLLRYNKEKREQVPTNKTIKFLKEKLEELRDIKKRKLEEINGGESVVDVIKELEKIEESWKEKLDKAQKNEFPSRSKGKDYGAYTTPSNRVSEIEAGTVQNLISTIQTMKDDYKEILYRKNHPLKSQEELLQETIKDATDLLESLEKKLEDAKKGIFDEKQVKLEKPFENNPEVKALRFQIASTRKEIARLKRQQAQMAEITEEDIKQRHKALVDKIQKMTEKLKDIEVNGYTPDEKKSRFALVDKNDPRLSEALAKIKQLNKEINKAKKADKRAEAIRLRDRRLQSIKEKTNAYTRALSHMQETKKPLERQKKGYIDMYQNDAEFMEAYKALQNIKTEIKRFEQRLDYENGTKGKKALHHIRDLATTSKLLRSSLDASFTWTQCAFLMLRNPVLAVKAVKMGLQAAFDPEFAESKQFEFTNGEDAYARIRAGLRISEIGDTDMSKQEEAFSRNLFKSLSSYINKNPVTGKILQASERAFVVPVNWLRVLTFDSLCEMHNKKPHELDEETAKTYAKWVNIYTGRGDFYGNPRALGVLNNVFWAPGLVSAHLQQATAPIELAIDGFDKEANKKVAKELILKPFRNLMIIYGLRMLIWALTKDEDDEEPPVDLNPISSNFLRIRIGGRWVSVTGGMEKVLSLTAQSIAGKKKNSIGKTIALRGPEADARNRTVVNEILNFFQNKVNPLVGVGMGALDGKERFGDYLNTSGDWMLYIGKNLFLPLPLEDMVDACEEEGIPKGLFFTALSFWGMKGASNDVNLYEKTKHKFEQEVEYSKGLTGEELAKYVQTHPTLRIKKKLSKLAREISKLKSQERKTTDKTERAILKDERESKEAEFMLLYKGQ